MLNFAEFYSKDSFISHIKEIFSNTIFSKGFRIQLNFSVLIAKNAFHIFAVSMLCVLRPNLNETVFNIFLKCIGYWKHFFPKIIE